MPLPGPTAAKVGLRYEDAWTAHCALRVLAGDASSIYLEEPGTADHGFEFSLVVGETTEYHQVKRQRSADGGWTLKALAGSGVLPAFRKQLASPTAVCVFASGNAAQTLDELATAAQKAPSWEKFSGSVLSYATRERHFRQLRDIWEEDDHWTFEALRRLRVECIGERQLADLLRLETQVLLDGPIGTAPDILTAALRRRENERLDAPTLWADLRASGFKPNPWQSSDALFARIDAVNDAFKKSRASTLIGNRLISRPETERIWEAIADHQVVLVEGIAGSGKSDVLYELTRRLDHEQVRYLVFRLDRWKSTPSPEDLAAQMNLPVSPPAALAALSPHERSVLIIDQLDAMSSASGRNTEFFECVDGMLRLAMTRTDITVVLACRQFDARNDARLRRLLGDAGHTVPVGLLTDEHVSTMLGELDVDEARITPQLRQLLRVPLHLALFHQISPLDPAKLPALTTLRALYDEFWSAKQAELAQRLGREANWTTVLDELIEDMNTRASLQAPTEIIDAWEADRAAMLSSSVLLEDNGQLAFFHETFFDYVFARRFFARRRTVRDLLTDDQLLFRRAQVRQLLAYERHGAIDTYIADVRYLLLDPSVRFHIREVVLGWLATVEDPMDAEWEALDELLQAAGPVAPRVWAAISGPAWFAFLAKKGLIHRWLADEATARPALDIISAGQSASPEVAAKLLAGYRERSPDATNDVADVLQRSNLADSRETFDLFLALLESDDPSLGYRDFFFLAHDLHEKQPAWGCELIGAYLRNRLRAADAAEVVNPFGFAEPIIPRQLHIHSLVDGSARGAPQAFVEHVLPQMLEIVERTAQPELTSDTEATRDEVWHAAERHSRSDGLDDDLLSGMSAAVRQLARDDQQGFLDLLATHTDTEYETICGLLFEGFRARPEALADIAVDFVLADPRRLSVGRAGDDHWATREMLQAVSAQCSRDRFEQLEATVLNYVTSWEQSKSGYRSRGYGQFTLLEALPHWRLSDLGRRRLGEWQRKFERLEPYAPHGVTGGVVGSPIQSRATRKMKDAHWLRAFERYRSTDSDPHDFLKGGVHQLSQELEARAAEDPVRFAGLALRMPDDVHPYYFDALLRGVGASELEPPIEATRALLLRCHALPGRPCGRWIAQPLRRHRDAPLPLDLVEILTWYATRDPDPPAVSNDFSGDISDAQRIEMQGLNSVRGSIAYELADHIRRHEANVAPLDRALQSLSRDRSAAVRGMAIRTLTGLMRHREQLAVKLFAELAAHPDDLILAGRAAHEFLRFAAGRQFPTTRPVLDRMLRSGNPEVRTCGAVHASLAAFENPEAGDLAAPYIDADSACRVGATRVAAANIYKAPDRTRCETQLMGAFRDPDPDVREAARGVFRKLADHNFENGERLVDGFIASPGCDADGAAGLLAALSRADASPAAMSLRACNAYLDARAATGGDAGRGMAIHDAGELALRVYSGSRHLPEQNAALDVVDRVLELDSFRIRRSLAEYER